MAEFLDRIRQPEYTGENRCWPCTVTNVVLVAGIVVPLAAAGKVLVAVFVAAVGITAIGLRGYLVPYTPQFAPRLVSALPVDWPGHHEPGGSLSDSAADREAAPPTGDAILTALLEAEVLIADGEELLLADSFRETWRETMAAYRETSLEELAEAADDLTGPAVEVRVGSDWLGRPSTLVVSGDGGLTTLREPNAIAEVAAARALDGMVDDRVRLAAGRPLRSLLERCPACDEALTIDRSTCCGEVTPIGKRPPKKLRCRSCNVRLFTFE